MSAGNDLLERENQAANEADGLNPGQKHAEQTFNRGHHDDIEGYDRENDGLDDYDFSTRKDTHYTDSHGDRVASNYNADDSSADENIKSAKEKEEGGSSLYSKVPSTGVGGASGFLGKLAGKKTGPTSGVVGLILFSTVVVGGGSAGLAGSLLINLKEVFHNDRSDASRSNRLYSRAFLANKFKKDNVNSCADSKIKCKMSTMSKEDIKTYQQNGFKIEGAEIDSEGRDTGKRVENDKSLKPTSTTASPDSGDTADTHDPSARVLMEKVTYPDGTEVTSGKEYYAHADKNPEALRSSERAFHSKTSFYLNKFFKEKIVGNAKWKFSLGKKSFPETNANGEQDRAIDEQTGSENGRANYDPNAPPEERERDYSGTSNEIMEDSSSKAKGAGKAGVIGTLLSTVCMPYRIANGIVTSVKLYQITRLGLFFLTFVQAADEIKDGRGDGAKAAKLADNLTYYEANEKMTHDDDNLGVSAGDPNPRYNLSATDSQGYKTAAHGDTSALTAFAAAYILGGGSQSKIVKATNTIKESYEKTANSVGRAMGRDASGRRMMKEFCRSANNPIVQGAGCFTIVAGSGPLAVAGGVACACIAEQVSEGGSLFSSIPIVGNYADDVTGVVRDVAGDLIGTGGPNFFDMIGGACDMAADTFGDILSWATRKIIDNTSIKDLIEETLALFDVNSDTKGVDAGNAIAAGAGLVLSTAATGYGNKPASKKDNNKEITDYIAYTQPLEDKYIALEKADANENPFDMSNKYSVTGVLARALADNSAAPKSLFGNMTTIANLLPAAARATLTGQPVSALYNQPSTAAGGDSGRYDRCKDEDLESIGAAGDSYCSVVGVVSKRELQKAHAASTNEQDTMINDLTDWMSKQQPETVDTAGAGQTCAKIDGKDDENCEKSKQPSINKDTGAPVDDSQYAKYLKYCTEQRESPWGAQAEPYEQGSGRDQRWYSGEECMSDSTMVTNFRMWTNFCLQSGTRDGTSNCYSDDATAETETGSTAECAKGGGTKAIYTCALKYDDYLYSWGGGHGDIPDAQKWVEDFKSSPPAKWTPLLDCSGLVRVAFVEAMGIEDQAYVAPGGYDSSKYWTKISLEEAEQGDIITSDGHVAIVEANDKSARSFKIFHASTSGEPKEDNILHGEQSYGSTIAAYRAKK